MPTATLTTKGQVTIPKEVREHLGVETGDRLSFVVQDDGSGPGHAPRACMCARWGDSCTGRPAAPVSTAEMDRAIAAECASKFGRRR